jgi:AraC family transcriptional regulator, positive regulator of tynA and feaB
MKPTSQSFSTDLVPISDRLDAWLHNARQICGDCRFQFPKRHLFHGSIGRRALAGVELTRFASSPVSFAKFPIADATSENRACIVITQLEGVRRYCQNGRVSILRPWDSTLVDSGQPWSSECVGRCARLYLRLPRWLVQDRLRMNSLPILPRIEGTAGLGATLSRLATSLYEEADRLTLQEGRAAVEAYLQILSGCLSHPDAGPSLQIHQAELFARIDHFIDEHLAEPTLDPAEIAFAARVSVRHLHRLFVTKGRTVAESIRERRLERCRTDLADHRLYGKSITEIAFDWGFSDSAHFSRCFKKQFGISPRAFRSNPWTTPWIGEPSDSENNLLALEKISENQPN